MSAFEKYFGPMNEHTLGVMLLYVRHFAHEVENYLDWYETAVEQGKMKREETEVETELIRQSMPLLAKGIYEIENELGKLGVVPIWTKPRWLSNYQKEGPITEEDIENYFLIQEKLAALFEARTIIGELNQPDS
jgi:hypothetical protein